MLFLVVIVTLFGACVGSFCNVLIIRLHEGSSIGGRSHCPVCRKTLKPTQLIPIVSWIVLRARCAFCHHAIHWQYPLVEAAGAVIGAVSVMTAQTQGNIDVGRAVFTACFLFTLLVITAFDVRWQLVPVQFVVGSAITVGILSGIIGGWGVVPTLIGGALSTAFILAMIVMLSGGRMMGDGDPFVGLLLGAALGWPLGPLSLGLAFMIGGATAAALLLTGSVHRKTAVPFVPFLAAGAIVAYFHQASVLAFLHYGFF